MIVHDLDVVRVGILPPKTDSPLIVDANAVLPGAIAFQLFQTIAGRAPQVVKRLGRIDEDELAQHRTLEITRISPNAFTLE
jgi:hypothetical protein